MPHENKKSETPCGISEQQTNGNGCCNPPFRTFFFHPDYTVGLGVSPNHAFAKRRPLAGFTAGRELHPALKNPDIRLCKAVYRFAEIKYIPLFGKMQPFFAANRKGAEKRRGRHPPSPPWEEYKRKEKDCGSLTKHSIAETDEIQSKKTLNLCKK